MCPNSRILKRVTPLAMLLSALLGASGRAAPEPDPLLPYLRDDRPEARAQALDLLKSQGRAACEALGAYANHPASRVRESAVRTMNDAGCPQFAAYGAYLHDGAAGVVDAIVDAAERRLMTDAVPFLLGSLSDRRRIVTDEGVWSIGERAERALMVITCQSFHYDFAASRDDQRNSLTRWRQWYLAKRSLPREDWIQEGIGRAQDYAGRDYIPYRLEGLRLLTLIGPPAAPALRTALARHPDQLKMEVVCQPDEAPRPGDAVPCTLVVRNGSRQSLAIAPSADAPAVRWWPVDADADGDAAPAAPASRFARPSGTWDLETLAAFADRLIEVPAGGSRRFDFVAGPVSASGRYRVRAEIDDLTLRLFEDRREPDSAAPRGVARPASPVASPPRTLGAETILRFEQ